MLVEKKHNFIAYLVFIEFNLQYNMKKSCMLWRNRVKSNIISCNIHMCNATLSAHSASRWRLFTSQHQGNRLSKSRRMHFGTYNDCSWSSLIKNNRTVRLNFTRKHVNWLEVAWERVLFMDESRYHNDRPIRVYLSPKKLYAQATSQITNNFEENLWWSRDVLYWLVAQNLRS